MVFAYIKMAWKGRRAWLKLDKAHALREKSAIVFMPDDDSELNYCALKHLDQYLKKHYLASCALLIADHGDKFESENIGEEVKVIFVPAETMELILCYYRLVNFRERLKVISLNDPYGSRGLLKKDGVDIDYMVVNYIYR